MQFTYENLWKTLEKNGMNKTDLRRRLGVSTATIAKLSGNQPVAMEVLGKICDELGCSLNDVVTYCGNNMNKSLWGNVIEESTYLIRMFFYWGKESETCAKYIYGFTTPFRMNEEGMDRWKVSEDEEYLGFFVVDGFITGRRLLQFIRMAMENHMIGDMFEQLEIRLSGCKKMVMEAILTIQICNGEFVYRPPFFLPSSNSCVGIKEVVKPLMSYEEDMMVCESLFGLKKREFYLDDNIPDCKKADCLWRFLRKELPLHHNLNEMARLNNFEVFSYLNGNADENTGVSWKIVDHEDKETMNRVVDAIEICLDHSRFQGKYAINLRLSNTQNPFMDTMDEVYCEEEDVKYRRCLPESVSYVEIRIYKLGKNSTLIYHTSVSLIREFHFNMCIHERKMIVEDEWTRKMERAKKGVDKEVEFYSSTFSSFGNTDNEPWYKEEQSVQRDFYELLGNDNIENIGEFFSDKVDKSIEFLTFLKKTLKKSSVHRVILIDPYIEAETIVKFIRSISNCNVEYELYTDSYVGKNAGENSERIKKIRSIQKSLEYISPTRFSVHTLITGDAVLHDRFLIIMDEQLVPKVFVLTNSLDGIAQKHASIVTQVNKNLARKVFEYYGDMFANKKAEDKMECLFDSANIKKIPVRELKEEKTDKLEIENKFEEFQIYFKKDLKYALRILAYMQSDEKEKCRDYIEKQILFDIKNKDVEEGTLKQELIKILEEGVEIKDSIRRNGRDYRILSASQLLMKEFDFVGELLESAETLLKYGFEFTYCVSDWTIYYACKLLWKIDSKVYCKILGQFLKQAKIYKILGEDPSYIMVAQMLGVIVNELSYANIDEGRHRALLKEEIPLLRALGIVQILHLKGEGVEQRIKNQVLDLDELESLSEKVISLIYFMKALQIEICIKKEKGKEFQQIVDWLGTQVVETLKESKKVEEDIFNSDIDKLYECLHILYLRNSEDICKILIMLWKKKILSKDMVENLLIRLCMEKYELGIQGTYEYFRKKDIDESIIIIGYLKQIDKEAVQALKKQMGILERKVSKKLYRAFLKSQNYNLWKRTIDLYGCLVCLEVYIVQLYPKENEFLPSVGVKEFNKLSSNYVDTLEKYSEVYNVWKELDVNLILK